MYTIAQRAFQESKATQPPASPAASTSKSVQSKSDMSLNPSGPKTDATQKSNSSSSK